jgi:hypothetical protein
VYWTNIIDCESGIQNTNEGCTCRFGDVNKKEWTVFDRLIWKQVFFHGK